MERRIKLRGKVSRDAEKPGHGYPRPMMEREEWINLNGEWDFAIDAEAKWTLPNEVAWGQKIAVPFSPETKLSGVHDTGYYRAVWYGRKIEAPKLEGGGQLLLHFGAVDFAARVWVNGELAGEHEGGYTPFCVNITEHLRGTGADEVVVRAEDDPLDLAKPRGKQDWLLHPHSIWYPRTSGIWQTVWMETVSATRLEALRWTPDVKRWEISLEAAIDGARRTGLRLHVRLEAHGKLLAEDIYGVTDNLVQRVIALCDPGVEDARRALLWSPDSPTLIHAHLRLLDETGAVIDEVRSYTAMRSVGILGDRFTLNGTSYMLRLVLDQGYYVDGGLTAPTDEAMRRDVELAKAMGFNGVRKHQKIEDPRYLYWADRLGLLVWEEMPSAYQFSRTSVERLTREWMAILRRDLSHPCIVAWVPFNESWGVPDLPVSAAQRDYVTAIYHLTKTLDPSRLVSGNDGWEAVATDIVGIHDYDSDAERLGRRYSREDGPATLFKGTRPAGKRLSLNEPAHVGLPLMMTEFGGVAFSSDTQGTWGYSRVPTSEGLANQYCELLCAVRSAAAFSGFCYTQFADTYQESNGLLHADRTPKFSLEQMSLATRGPWNPQEREAETLWRERIAAGKRRNPGRRRKS